jgi:hypothetical protein
MRWFVSAVVACGLLAGCGGDGGPPTGGAPRFVALSVSPDRIVLPAIPATFALTVVATQADGSEVDVAGAPSTLYFSSSTAVAGVATGVVSAASEGEAWIVAEVAGGVRDSARVRVDETSAIAVDSLAASPAAIALPIGGTAGLAGVVAWENGARLAMTGLPFLYATDDDAVASISANGVVRGLAPGNATVTITFGALARSVPVAVALPPRTVVFSRSVLPILLGECTFSGCHAGVGTPQRGLRLNSYANLRAGGVNGPVVIPGASGSSRIVLALRGALRDTHRMPLGRTPLPEATLQTIETWIDEGAFDD